MSAIRPQTFAEFAGQAKALGRLKVAVSSALQRKKPLAHVLLEGPPGLGKTSLAAGVLPTELGCRVTALNCAAVERPQDLLPTLTTIKAGDILFLDEIHSLQGTGCFDYLLTALEDSRITVKAGEGPRDPLIPIDLPKFTIIGATTRAASLPEPVRDRFAHRIRLELYEGPEMCRVLFWTAQKRGLTITPEAATALIDPCHGTARFAVNLVEACRDTVVDAQGPDCHHITVADVTATLERLGYVRGLTDAEHRYLGALATYGRPMGLSTLAGVLDEAQQMVEEATEPWLLQRHYIEKTPQGRTLAPRGRLHLAAI